MTTTGVPEPLGFDSQRSRDDSNLGVCVLAPRSVIVRSGATTRCVCKRPVVLSLSKPSFPNTPEDNSPSHTQTPPPPIPAPLAPKGETRRDHGRNVHFRPGQAPDGNPVDRNPGIGRRYGRGGRETPVVFAVFRGGGVGAEGGGRVFRASGGGVWLWVFSSSWEWGWGEGGLGIGRGLGFPPGFPRGVFFSFFRLLNKKVDRPVPRPAHASICSFHCSLVHLSVQSRPVGTHTYRPHGSAGTKRHENKGV